MMGRPASREQENWLAASKQEIVGSNLSCYEFDAPIVATGHDPGMFHGRFLENLALGLNCSASKKSAT